MNANEPGVVWNHAFEQSGCPERRSPVNLIGAGTVGRSAEILSIHTPSLFQAAVRRAVECLRSGRVVALPTETVYGLAANAFDKEAVARIYEIKGRPSHNPTIVHIAGSEMARQCAAHWPALAKRLAAAFWPGPLTLVLPRSNCIPDIVVSGGSTVGLRWPSHPFIQAVIRECGFPLAAPSANLSNQVSPTTAAHVRKQLGHKVELIVDGGPSQVGIESTVLDVTRTPPRVLRPGVISRQMLGTVAGPISGHVKGAAEHAVRRSPGMLRKHYAPKAKLVILAWRDDADLKSQITNLKFKIAGSHVIVHSRIPSMLGFGGVSVIPHDAEAYARAIYAELHRCDEAGAELIVVEELPPTAEWRALADRLSRAAA